MATMIKGLSFFPLNTNFFENEKIEIINAKYGLEASAVMIKLLCKIYNNSFYIKWDETICKVFTKQCGTRFNSSKVWKIIDEMINLTFFDKSSFEKHGILTSKKIQEIFFEAISRRKRFDCKNVEYLLIPLPDKLNVNKMSTSVQCEERLNEEKCNISDNSSTSNVDIFEQKKREEKKREEKRKKEKINLSSSSSSACACAREANGVIVLEEEIKKPNSFSENCKKWNAELMKDEEWLSSVVRSSGKGSLVLRLLPEIMDYFEQHIVSIGETGSMLNINDYKRRLINWWRYLKFQSVPEILEQQNSKPRKIREEKKSKVDEAMECAQRASVIAQRLLEGGGL